MLLTQLCYLFLGTIKDNIQDMVAKGRQSKGVTHGSQTKPWMLPRGDSHYARLRPEALARGDRHGSRLHPERVARGNRHGSKTHPEKWARGDRNGARLHIERMPRGESNPASKMTADKVIAIRERHAKGNVTQAQLAAEYGIYFSTVNKIVQRKTWKHIP